MGLSRGSYPIIILVAVIIVDIIGLGLGIASTFRIRNKGGGGGGRVERGGSNASSASNASSISSITTSSAGSHHAHAPTQQQMFNSNGSNGGNITLPATKSSSCNPCQFLDGSGVKGIYIALVMTYLCSFILVGAVSLLAFDIVGMAVFGVASRAFCLTSQPEDVANIVNDFAGNYQVCVFGRVVPSHHHPHGLCVYVHDGRVN